MKSGDRILDAGAGGGEVVYVLRQLGFDASGLEPDEQYARHAREALGVPVATGFVQDAAFPAGSFDVVTMYHALEHVEDPSAILSRLRGWMVDEGVLLIEVPNVEAVCIAPAHRFHFAHFYNFNRDDARGARAESGLRAGADDDLAGRRQSDQRVQGGGACRSRRGLIAANYARVAGVVKRPHAAEVLLLRRRRMPGPLSRLRTYLADRRAARGCETPRQVLDKLILIVRNCSCARS